MVRSPLAESIFNHYVKRRGYSIGRFDSPGDFDFYVGSAGVRAKKDGNVDSVQLTEEMVSRADKVFCMDSSLLDILEVMWDVPKEKLVDLHVDSDIAGSEAAVKEDLIKRLEPYFPEKK
ncbi:hypothetical protein KA107_01715 [Candidatus Pacearchaeota archaeon]|nr:hypothetical protein [Candidatus Pacearchaeota archaeon]